MKKVLLVVLFGLLLILNVKGQTTQFIKHENVIYGMISGMALLMDVYEPKNGNGKGIVIIYGSGWGFGENYQPIYNHVPLKDDYFIEKEYFGKWSQGLVDRGYTVFAINHRFSPSYHYPDGLEDCRRAVRYIRYHAKEYNINPDHIGAMGHSSGGYFAAMLGVLDRDYSNIDKSPIDSVSSTVQAVVTLAATFNLSDLNIIPDMNIELYPRRVQVIMNYMGELPESKKGIYVLTGKYAEASPITHVTKSDAPILIYHSNNDPIVPHQQATTMYNKLIDNGVETKLKMDPKSGHVPKPNLNEVDDWFKRYLK